MRNSMFTITLRFQIEFNFRDAKQYWGLDDFMNVKQTAVTNAANLSFFMVNFSSVLLRPLSRKATLIQHPGLEISLSRVSICLRDN